MRVIDYLTIRKQGLGNWTQRKQQHYLVRRPSSSRDQRGGDQRADAAAPNHKMPRRHDAAIWTAVWTDRDTDRNLDSENRNLDRNQHQYPATGRLVAWSVSRGWRRQSTLRSLSHADRIDARPASVPGPVTQSRKKWPAAASTGSNVVPRSVLRASGPPVARLKWSRRQPVA